MSEFDLLVQRGFVLFDSEEHTKTINLNTPVPVSQSFATITCSGGDNRRERVLAIAVLQGETGGNYTQLRIDRGIESNSAMQYAWQVITSTEISVQQVLKEDVDSGSQTSNTTINSVDLSKTFVVSSDAPDGNGDRSSAYRHRLTSSTNLEVRKQTSFANQSFFYCDYVITVDQCDVQRGTIALSGMTTDVQVNNTDPNTFCIFTNFMDDSVNNNDGDRNRVQGVWINNSTYRFKREDSTGIIEIAYEFVNIPGLNLRRINNLTIGNNDFEANETIDNLDLNKSFVLVNHLGNSSGESDRNMLNHRITSSNNLRVERRYQDGISVETSSQVLNATDKPGNGIPDPPQIVSINSGNTEIFVNFELGNEGSSPITDVEYQLNGGVWNSGGTVSSPLIITGQPNQSQYTEIRIRAINSAGASSPSNMMEGRATKRPYFERFLILNENLHATNAFDNTEFIVGRATNPQFLFDLTESWEQSHGFVPSYPGSVLLDHEGKYRFYYTIRTQNNEVLTGVAVSENGINNWTKPNKNVSNNPINNSNSNLVAVFHNGNWLDENIILNAVYYDSSSDNYKGIFSRVPGKPDESIFIGTSGDGWTWTIQEEIITGAKADTNHSLLFDEQKNQPWVLYGRERLGHGPGQDPDPYIDRRNVVINSSDNWDDNGWIRQNHKIIDSAEVWNYVNVDWGDPPLLKPDIYTFSVNKYYGQYIGIYPYFGRDDNRRSFDRPERTVGPIFPRIAYSEDGEN